MAEMSRRLPDTPWHVGYARKKDSDPRRHKARCIYYDNATKKCTTAKSSYIGCHCGGSAHCMVYSEKRTQEIEQEEQQFAVRIKKQLEKKSLVTVNDTIVLRNLDCGTNAKYKMTKNKNTDKSPSITLMCVGKSLGDEFTYRGCDYKIVRIVR